MRLMSIYAAMLLMSQRYAAAVSLLRLFRYY